MMIYTLGSHEAAQMLLNDPHAAWSVKGAHALVEHLQMQEDRTGESIQFDVVALRCAYSEYGSALDAAADYGWEADADMDEDAQEEAALLWLSTQTEVIDVDGRVIIGTF